jgi:hypothetical protein
MSPRKKKDLLLAHPLLLTEPGPESAFAAGPPEISLPLKKVALLTIVKCAR